MGLFSVIAIAIAVSIDGFWGGFAFGLRKIRISFPSLLIISSWSIVCTFIAMIIGHNLKTFIPIEYGKYIGAGLLVLLGIFTIKEGYRQGKGETSARNEIIGVKFKISNLFKILQNPILADMDQENDIKPFEGTMLGLAVAMDASIAAFTLALMGLNPYITPFLFGFTHFSLIGAGNILARQNLVSYVTEKFSLLPGFILIALGILRLL